MRVLKIIHGTIVDGIGFRTSIYFSGCKHYCKGCHNPESWNMNGGENYSINDILNEIRDDMFNVTFTGGDPLFQNIDELTILAQEIKKMKLNIWLYTGYTIDEIINDNTYQCLLKNIDVVVDGKFELDKKDDTLQFRGSSNQRLIKILPQNDRIKYSLLVL